MAVDVSLHQIGVEEEEEDGREQGALRQTHLR